MAEKKSAADYANMVCNYLKENQYTTYHWAGKPTWEHKWKSTQGLAIQLNIPATSMDTLTKNLDKLALVGVLEKGKSKHGRGYAWRLKVENWNRSNPFLPTAMASIAATTPQPAVTPSQPPQPGEVERLKARVGDLEKTVQEMQAQEGQMVKALTVTRWDGKVTTLEDVVLPTVFKKVMALAGCRRNLLLVGPAGCGKSHIAELVSKSLNLQFGAVNCTSGMSEAHLTGRGIQDLAHGKIRFQGTDFLTCYESGGVFCFDEMDAADPNLLLSINTALANDYCNVPNRPEKTQARRHKDFIPIATANTWGRGATRQYAGRNQLDEATLDRFRIGVVECDYDMAVERALCPDDALRHLLQTVRTRIAATGLRRILSTRFIRDAFIMKEGAGWTHENILETFFSGWTPEEVAKVKP